MILIGRILVAANCHVKPSLLIRISGRYLLTCARISSSSSVQLLSALTHPQHHSSQLYHTCIFHHHTSCARHPRISTPSLTVCWRHASSVSSPPEEGEPSWLKQRWIKFKTIIKAFVAGSKALYSDVKKMRQIQSKHRGRKMVLGQPPRDGRLDFPLTRDELLFITKVRREQSHFSSSTSISVCSFRQRRTFGGCSQQ